MGTSVRQILANKNSTVWFVTPDSTALEAVQLMSQKNVGAVLVMDGKALVGILSERDCTRKALLLSRPFHGTAVRDIMTAEVASVRPDQTIEECMRIMTEWHIRHLPVVGEDGPIGVVSMRDVVREIVSQQLYTIDQLETYIAGSR